MLVSRFLTVVAVVIVIITVVVVPAGKLVIRPVAISIALVIVALSLRIMAGLRFEAAAALVISTVAFLITVIIAVFWRSINRAVLPDVIDLFC